MPLTLNPIGQTALPVADVDRSGAFYVTTLGLRKLYRLGDLTFFDCAGLRLLLEKTYDPAAVTPAGCLYLRGGAIALMVTTLEERGVAFTPRWHLIARMEDHDLWMAFFRDPDGHILALT